MNPQLRLEPQFRALPAARALDLSLVVHVQPPEFPVDASAAARPPVNVALVLDRSGSMAGDTEEAERDAVCAALGFLGARDRASVVAFDDHVTVPVPEWTDASRIEAAAAVRRIESGGSTALHAGWLEGAGRVATALQPAALNRVILLTDGQANAGETNPARIAADVRGLAGRGVSTSTLGFGRDYNEHLLEAMAQAGDGNYAFVESASQLEEIFAGEFRGLLRQCGRRVSLGFEPTARGARAEMWNPLPLTDTGRWMLPNLRFGEPLSFVLRLTGPAADAAPGGTIRLGTFRLAWDDPRDGRRRTETLRWEMPVVSEEEYSAQAAAPAVEEAVRLQEIARDKRRAAEELDRGDVDAAAGTLQRTIARAAAMPASPAAAAELEELRDIEAGVREDAKLTSKKARYSAYKRERSS